MSLTREQLVHLARYNEIAERYGAMKDYMKKIALTFSPLSIEEINLFSLAFKNCTSVFRTSLRVFQDLETREKNKEKGNLDLIQLEKAKVEFELTSIRQELLEIVTKEFIDKQQGEESKVFFWKMQGDYKRYMCEYLTGNSLETCIEESRIAYEEAMKIAKDLSPINSIRLGMILNYSVFYFEIIKDEKQAKQLCKDAFDQAIAENSECLVCEDSVDSTMILQLIKDNLTLWSTCESCLDEGNQD